jgi:hypothetical protein
LPLNLQGKQSFPGSAEATMRSSFDRLGNERIERNEQKNARNGSVRIVEGGSRIRATLNVFDALAKCAAWHERAGTGKSSAVRIDYGQGQIQPCAGQVLQRKSGDIS